MENSLSNINSNSNSWKIALAIAIPIAIVPKKAIAIAVSILLLMSGVHHTPSVIWFRAYSSTNLCMAFVSTEIRTPVLVVRSQSSIDGATPQLAQFRH